MDIKIRIAFKAWFMKYCEEFKTFQCLYITVFIQHSARTMFHVLHTMVVKPYSFHFKKPRMPLLCLLIQLGIYF